MEDTNVNKLNGVPNFGHGLPADGVVQAGITDVPNQLPELQDNSMDNEEKIVEAAVETHAEEDG